MNEVLDTFMHTPDDFQRVEILHRYNHKLGSNGMFYRVTQRAPGGGWYLIAEVRTIAELANLVDLAELQEGPA